MTAKPETLQHDEKETNVSSTLRILHRLIPDSTKEGAIFIETSRGELFSGAFFGRDSLEAGIDLVDSKPEVVKGIILAWVQTQGTRYNQHTREEPGRGLHEYRNRNHPHITETGQEIITKLGKEIFGIPKDEAKKIKEITTYRSVDSSLLFINLVNEFCSRYGEEILDNAIINKDEKEVSVREAVTRAGKWLMNRLVDSNTGLLEHVDNAYEHYWKDGRTSLADTHGSIPSLNSKIAVIDIQGLAFQAMSGLTEVLDDDSLLETIPDSQKQEGKIDPKKFITEKAERIRDKTLNLLWSEEDRYFYPGLKKVGTENQEPIDAQLADSARLLETGFFYGMDEEEKEKYITGIIEHIFDPESFYTHYGIRSRSIKSKGLDYPAYQGEYTIWMKENVHILRGLIDQELYELADQLAMRILSGAEVAHRHLEFIYADPKESPEWYGTEFIEIEGDKSDEVLNDLKVLHATNIPDHDQLWTVTGALAAWSYLEERTMGELGNGQSAPWKDRLQNSVRRNLKNRDKWLEFNSINDPRIRQRYLELQIRIPHTVGVNIAKGRDAENDFVERALRESQN